MELVGSELGLAKEVDSLSGSTAKVGSVDAGEKEEVKDVESEEVGEVFEPSIAREEPEGSGGVEATEVV